MKVFQAIARKLQARDNCLKGTSSLSREWAQKHEESIVSLIENYLPHGSGFDSGTKIDLDRSTPEKLVFFTSFHHMNEHGMYIGWSNHDVIVRPSLTWGFDLRVTGRDRKSIKAFIEESFDYDLKKDVEVKES